MPIYSYKCTKCNKEKELFIRKRLEDINIIIPNPIICDLCGGEMTKLMNKPGLIRVI